MVIQSYAERALAAAVHVENLTKTYGAGRQTVTALAGVTATYTVGTFTAVTARRCWR